MNNYKEQFRETWAQMTKGFIETGEHLLEAKAALPPDDFNRMIRFELDFDEQTAHLLMKMARNPEAITVDDLLMVWP